MMSIPVCEEQHSVERLFGKATEWRLDIGLEESEPFNFELAAAELDVELTTFGHSPAQVKSKHRLLVQRPDLVRGALRELSDGHQVLVLNDVHGDNCQRFTAAHELSHIVLGHRVPTVSADEDGSYRGDSGDEREANTLAVLALVPVDPDASGQSVDQLAEKYKVEPSHIHARARLAALKDSAS